MGTHPRYACVFVYVCMVHAWKQISLHVVTISVGNNNICWEKRRCVNPYSLIGLWCFVCFFIKQIICTTCCFNKNSCQYVQHLKTLFDTLIDPLRLLQLMQMEVQSYPHNLLDPIIDQIIIKVKAPFVFCSTKSQLCS